MEEKKIRIREGASQRFVDSVGDNLEPSSACGVLSSALLACLHDFAHVPRWANLENVAVAQRRVLADELYDIGPIRNHQLIGFTPKDEQVNVSQELRSSSAIVLVWSQQPSRVMLIAKITFLIGLSCPFFCTSAIRVEALRVG